MKHLQTYTRYLLQGLLAAAVAWPAVSSGHGAVDNPVARQVHCKLGGGEWQSEDGSSIPDRGCREAAAVFKTPAERAYPGQQWNEVAMLVKDYNNDQAVMAAIPDGTLCAAGDPKKASLDKPTRFWHKTALTATDSLPVRIIGTAPHVPSFVKIYLSKPGYDGTRALRWSDLELIHSERFTRARTDWQTPPTIAGASGFFEVKASLPANRSGDAVLYVRWQREDPAGEGFYNCSDISFNDTGIPQPELHEKGPFIPAEIQPKPGDTVRFRILGSSEDAAEIVDVRQEITAANSTPNVWGKQIFLKVAPTVAVIGEPLEGRARSNAIKFNETDHRANLVFVRNKNDSPAMSISSGGGGDPEPVDPRPPVARIDGLSTVKSGDIFTLNGSGSIGYNGPLVYQWVVPWTTLDPNQSSVRLTAPTVTEATTYEVLLGVLDEKNKTRHQAEHRVTVSPASAGEYPAYSPADLSKYNPGTIISNHGKNYQCKPFPEGGWCKQSPPHYEPGAGSNWTDAWNVY